MNCKCPSYNRMLLCHILNFTVNCPFVIVSHNLQTLCDSRFADTFFTSELQAFPETNIRMKLLLPIVLCMFVAQWVMHVQSKSVLNERK